MKGYMRYERLQKVPYLKSICRCWNCIYYSTAVLGLLWAQMWPFFFFFCGLDTPSPVRGDNRVFAINLGDIKLARL